MKVTIRELQDIINVHTALQTNAYWTNDLQHLVNTALDAEQYTLDISEDDQAGKALCEMLTAQIANTKILTTINTNRLRRGEKSLFVTMAGTQNQQQPKGDVSCKE